MNARIDGVLSTVRRQKTFGRTIEFNTVPVVLEGAEFRKSYALTGGKCLLSGAAWQRLLNRYIWENETRLPDPEKTLCDYFSQLQRENAGAGLPGLKGSPPADIGFAVECRNTFNYFHFMTETLPQLCLAAESGGSGPVYLHYPNQDDKTRGFVRGFIDLLFPELADRMVYQRTPARHDRVMSAFNLQNAYYQFPKEDFGSVDEFAPEHGLWQGRWASRLSHAILAQNSVDSSLIKLRQTAFAAVEGMDFSHLPRRFWVSRKPARPRARPVEGEANLLEALRPYGFQEIAFETLSPAEQIGIMSQAEVMIAAHGAGFANMMFAGPACTVIELGTLQTAVYRWGDFWRLANASQCTYASFFADFAAADPLAEPRFSQDGIVPVALGRAGLDRLTNFVGAILGQVPRLTQAEDLLYLARQLHEIGATVRAKEVINAHPELRDSSADLLLQLAVCHEALKEDAQQLYHLYAAYRADTSRWQVIIQALWCARKVNNSEALSAGLAVLREGFPDRFNAFLRDRPWFRAYA